MRPDAHRTPPVSKPEVEVGEFPLAANCDYCLVCEACFTPHTILCGMFAHNAALAHECAENTLAVRRKGEPLWVKIRERKNHREFHGSYRLCKSTSLVPPVCERGEYCLFAHNKEEMILWTLEKDGAFSLAEFTQRVRSDRSAPLYTVAALLKRYPGEMRFLCGACYAQQSRLCQMSAAGTGRCQQELHDWQVWQRRIR